jgi:hypothetical protein
MIHHIDIDLNRNSHDDIIHRKSKNKKKKKCPRTERNVSFNRVFERKPRLNANVVNLTRLSRIRRIINNVAYTSNCKEGAQCNELGRL